MALPERCHAVVATVLAALLLLFVHTSGQGLAPQTGGRGSSDRAYDRIRSYTADAAVFRGAYASNPSSTCNKRSGWCAAPASSDNYTRLVVAASPDAYDARTDAGDGWSPLSPVGDQAPCSTSVAFAVTAAAEAAAASAMRVNASSLRLSQQDLHFCPGARRGCNDDAPLQAALERIAKGNVSAEDCLPYTAPTSDDPANLCSYRCSGPPALLRGGRFGFTPLRDVIPAQKQLRRYNAFVTRLNVYEDLSGWLTGRGKDPSAVYDCPRNSTPAPSAAAVVVVGYNNKEGFWIVRGSWGTGVGDRGYFKVKYGVCGLMTHGDTYGMYFIPQRPVPLLVTAAPTSSSSDKPTTDARCFVYRGRRDDYMSKVADRAVVPIGTLLADNTGVVRALDKPLTGIRLRMCNPDPAAIGTVKQPTQQERPGGTGGSGKPALPSAGSGTQVGGGGSAGGGSSGGPDRGNSGGGIVDDGGSAGGSVKGIASVLPEAGPAMISTSPPSSSAAKVGVSSSSSPQGLAVADEPPAGEEEAAALLSFKAALSDPNGSLSAWRAGTLPCGDSAAGQLAWPGVFCSTRGGQKRVYFLDLSQLGLKGSLANASESLVPLARLQALWMSDNDLSGMLPTALGLMTHLKDIKLDNNGLTGTLPPEWANLPKMRRIELDGNQISGPLPPEWGSLTGLKQLLLADNLLSGTVPSSWAGMANLTFCSLYENEGLRGCLPFDWNARRQRVKLTTADGSTAAALEGTCLCGYCTGATNTQCESAASVRCAAASSSNTTRVPAAGSTLPGASNISGTGSDTAVTAPLTQPAPVPTVTAPPLAAGTTAPPVAATTTAPPAAATATAPPAAATTTAPPAAATTTAPPAASTTTAPPAAATTTAPPVAATTTAPPTPAARGVSAAGTAAAGAPPPSAGAPTLLPSPTSGLPGFGGLGNGVGTAASTVPPDATVIDSTRKSVLQSTDLSAAPGGTVA